MNTDKFQELVSKMSLIELDHEILRLEGKRRGYRKADEVIAGKDNHPYPSLRDWSSRKRGYTG